MPPLDIDEFLRNMPPQRTPEAPNVARASPDVPVTCNDCGACCAKYSNVPSRGCTIGKADEERYIDANGKMRHDDNNRCEALCGSVGAIVFCSIYEDRPAACREFERGTDSCLRARASHAIGRVSPVAKISSTKKAFKVRVDGEIIAHITRSTMFISAGPGTNPMIYSNPVRRPYETSFFSGVWPKFVQQVLEHHFVRLDQIRKPDFLP